MPLADDLLIQARMLATVDTGIPLQANLRRAISSAYYALFHLLIAEAVDLIVPKKPVGLASKVARTFAHGEMDRVCNDFTKSPLPEKFAAILPQGVPAELQKVAIYFSQLQDARHLADYDTAFNPTRDEALIRVASAESAFSAWRTIQRTEEATVFLTALAFGARWSK